MRLITRKEKQWLKWAAVQVVGWVVMVALAGVAALLVKNELNARLEKKAKRRRKAVLYTERGEKIELYQDVVKELEATG